MTIKESLKVGAISRTAELVTSISLNMVVGGICAAVLPGGAGVAMKAATTVTALVTGSYLASKVGTYVHDEIQGYVDGGIETVKTVKECVEVIKNASETETK